MIYYGKQTEKMKLSLTMSDSILKEIKDFEQFWSSNHTNDCQFFLDFRPGIFQIPRSLRANKYIVIISSLL